MADPAAAALALRLLCAATYVPRAARHLAQESGLIPWLASTAAAALQQLSQPQRPGAQQGWHRGGSEGSTGIATGPAASAEAALEALHRLLLLRAVMRGAGGTAAAQQMAAAACQLAAVAAAELGGGTSSRGDAGAAAARVRTQVLSLLQEVRRHVSVTGGAGQQARRPPAASVEMLGEIESGIEALR